MNIYYLCYKLYILNILRNIVVIMFYCLRVINFLILQFIKMIPELLYFSKAEGYTVCKAYNIFVSKIFYFNDLVNSS